MSKNLMHKLPTPIIVCGMHRSGTTLISKVLSQMGVFMGSDLEVNHEPLSFMLLNDKLLAYAHSFWDQIEGAYHFFNNEDAVIQASHILEQKLLTKKFFKTYFGKRTAINKFTSPWGWKDPRNTITFPLWLKIFPQAKFIFIYRNGIDSAASIVKREQEHSFDVSIPAYSSRCLDYKCAFELWDDFNRFFLLHKTKITPVNLLEIKYEDFLLNTGKNINLISNFVNIDLTDILATEISDKVNSNRAYSFKSNLELEAFYRKVEHNKTMIELGYKNLLDE